MRILRRNRSRHGYPVPAAPKARRFAGRFPRQTETGILFYIPHASRQGLEGSLLQRQTSPAEVCFR